MAMKCNPFLYADDTYLVFQSDNVKDIEKQLNEDLQNMWDWFADKVFTLEKIKPNLSFWL